MFVRTVLDRGEPVLKNEELSAWLFENGGPVVRYRTATELFPPNKSLDIQQLTHKMLRCPQVQKWLSNIRPPCLLLNNPVTTPHVLTSGIMEVHGSKPDNIENVLGKLSEFGVKKGVPELDERTLPYRKWLEKITEYHTLNVFDAFSMSLVAAFLARAGYTEELAVGSVLKKRLNTVYDFVRRGDYDIYVPGKYIRKLPLIKPDVVEGGVCRLPVIYDIIGWGTFLPKHGTEDDLGKADTIIGYIFNKEYQKFPWGYGVMGDVSGRTWSLGWSVHLPGFSGSISPNLASTLRVQMINLLINFRATRQHPWLKESLNHLEQFRTNEGTYLFPRNYLQEKPTGYWVNGYRMGLEENRRASRESESTFWMAKFHKMLE